MASQQSQSVLLTEQLRRAFDGDAWHGPAVLELLADVDAATAAARPLPNVHSIWELVLHIAVGMTLRCAVWMERYGNPKAPTIFQFRQSLQKLLGAKPLSTPSIRTICW